VVDKILVCGALIFLASADWARDTLPVWVVVLIVSREFMVSGLRGFIESRGHAFPARWDGKLKMVLQCVVVPAVFLQRMLDLGWPGETTWVQVADAIAVGSIWLMFAVTLTSGARYVMAAATVLKAGSA
jgi:phosphatidylglycerophosphate synthase